MRIYLLTLGAALMLASCGNHKRSSGFELKGKLTNTNGETIYLEKLEGREEKIVDSAKIEDDGSFEFNNYTPGIGFYRIKLNQRSFAMLVLDSTDKVNLTGNLVDLGNSYQVKGSPESELFVTYNNLTRRHQLRVDSLNKVAEMLVNQYHMNKQQVDSLTAQFEQPFNRIMESANAETAALVEKNTDKYASIMAIQSLEPEKYPDLYKALDAGLNKKYPNDQNVQMFHGLVYRIFSNSHGAKAPDIKLPNPEGKVIALSEFRGKIVLVDFWASWCAPCRREMPNVVAAYKKYRSKGFEIFGVSLDSDVEHWKEAIKEEGITWPQVSDLKQWQSDVVPMYGIEAIPFTVLLDKEGRIIAKNLRGEDLDKKLAEVLK